jgi:hypothetical protein
VSISKSEEVLWSQPEQRPQVLVIVMNGQATVVVRPSIVNHVYRFARFQPWHILIARIEGEERRHTRSHPIVRYERAGANPELRLRDQLECSTRKND